MNVTPETDAFLARPHIDKLLRDAVRKPLVTVVAGAGYGKTQAVSTALSPLGHRVAWLQLTEFDNLFARLWERIIFSFAQCSEQLAKNLAKLGYSDSPASLYQFLRLIEAELARQQERFILVFDDFHLLADKNVLQFFDHLVTALIPNLSIVIISRKKPPLALSWMLARDLIVRITEDELRYSKEEMAAYYEQRGMTLGASMLSSVYAYTEGWVFAIYLVGLSLKKGALQHQGSLTCVNDDIFALIEEEIFSAASGELQHFLVVVSLLDVTPAALFAVLAGDKPWLVTEMTSISLLIRYDAPSDSYRLHNLLRNFLLNRKNALSPDEVAQTHLLAADWYAKNGYPIEAMNHYRICGRYREVFDLIITTSQHFGKEIADSIIQLIDQAPAEIIEERPIMLAVKALHLFFNNRIDEARMELTQMRKKYEAMPETSETRAILGEAYTILALISIVSQTYEFDALFRLADACLPDGSALIDSRLNIADGINVCGIKNPIPGELRRYQDALFRVAPFASKVMNGCGYGMECLNAADSAYMTGSIKNAEKYAYEAIFRAQQREQTGIEFMANFILMRIAVYKGAYAEIIALLEQMKERLERVQNVDCMNQFDIIKGWFYVKIGKPEKVAKWILHEEETQRVLAPVILGREHLVRSDSLLSQGRDYELLAYMMKTDVFYEARGILYARIQNRITEAIIHHYLGNHDESVAALQKAYALSEPNGLIIQYIEYGSKMRTVVKAAMQDGACKIPTAWLSNIHTKSSTYAKQLAQVCSRYDEASPSQRSAPVSLSRRELEILTGLCHGLTREELSDNFALSQNTIKSILQSIYNKLGAVNSMDAVRIATMQRLV